MHTTNQFMVDFTLPEYISEEFEGLIPFQKQKVDSYIQEGILNSYMLSLEGQKLWAVFTANSEYDVLQFIAELPLTQFMTTKISMLNMNNGAYEIPGFSLN